MALVPISATKIQIKNELCNNSLNYFFKRFCQTPDFRFNIGGADSASFFIDLKIGCSFLLSRDYIEIGGGYLTNQQYFYLRPAVGIRIPTNANNPKQAVNLGVTYKLLTSNYWSSWERNITLNSLGAMISYEW